MTNSQSDNQSNTATHQSVHRHPLFFIEPLFVQVQNTLFQVPRVAFEGRAGSPFADAASLPTQNDMTVEGRTADNPVILPVAVKDFENLLHVMYASGLVFPDYSSEISNEQWRSTLRLATMWNFEDIRTRATLALDTAIKDPIERISVAREFKYHKWLISGYCDLVSGSAQALEANKCADALGWKTLALLHQARTEYDWTLYSDLPRLARHLNSGCCRLVSTCPKCHGKHRLGLGVPCERGYEARLVVHVEEVNLNRPISIVPDLYIDPDLIQLIERTFEDELRDM